MILSCLIYVKIVVAYILEYRNFALFMSFPQTIETILIHLEDGFVVSKRLLSLANIHAMFFIVMELHPVYVKGFSGLSYPARTDVYSDSPYKIWRNISNRIYLPKPFFRGTGKSWIWRNLHNKYLGLYFSTILRDRHKSKNLPYKRYV